MREPYTPAEDTYLTEDAIKSLEAVSGYAVDFGCSTGYLTRILAEKGFEAVGVDVNAEALKMARELLADFYGVVHLINAASLPFRRNALSAVIANPPYLPDDEAFHDPAIHGGPKGVETAIALLESAAECLRSDGLVCVTVSSLGDVDEFIRFASECGFVVREVKDLRVFFEKLHCFIFSLKP